VPEFVDAEEAAEYLDVKRSTLYAYASRGLVETIRAEGDERRTKYRKSDLARLKRRAAAESGHAPAASTALDWGAASLETEVGAITPRGPSYRGRRLRTLLEERATFETVGELLWTGSRREAQPWPAPEPEVVRLPPEPTHSVHPTEHLVTVVQRLRLADLRKYSRDRDAAVDCARRLLRGASLAARPVLADAPDTCSGFEGFETASVAETAARAVGVAPTPEAVQLVDQALVVVADHGLNPSTFAARVAASTGADLYASTLAALSTFAGPEHGLHSERVRTFCRGIDAPEAAKDAILDRLRRGESVPGFGHPLYEHGDPRYDLIRRRAREFAGDSERLDVIDEVADAGVAAGLSPPNLDVGLTAVVEALEAPVGAGPFLFAVGRMAGWLAHAMEQRERDEVLRPRSEYTGDLR